MKNQVARAPAPPPPGTGPDHHAVEPRREASTMALYVAVCLLAALTAIAEQADAGHVDVFKRPGTPVVRR